MIVPESKQQSQAGSSADMSYSLVLVNRASYQEIRDLVEIAELVRSAAPDIDTYVVSDEGENLVTRELAAEKPSLVVSFGEIRRFAPLRGRVYVGRYVPKDRQLIRMANAGIPVPRTVVVAGGYPDDVPRFGNLVVLKKVAQDSSGGRGVVLVRFEKLRQKMEELIQNEKWQYPILIQEFIRTGRQAATTRIATFLGQPILTWTSTLVEPLPEDGQPDDILEKTNIASNMAGVPKQRSYDIDPAKMALARRVFDVFRNIPLHGVDILTADDDRRYVLEMNGGGNTWHFSSDLGLRIRATHGGRAGMIAQMGAWGIIADALIRQTRLEAQ
jgi:hypothetical protein